MKDAENVSRIPSIEAAADQQVPGQLGVEGGASALHEKNLQGWNMNGQYLCQQSCWFSPRGPRNFGAFADFAGFSAFDEALCQHWQFRMCKR